MKGVKPELKKDLEEAEPLEFFQVFVTDDIIEYIVDETNRYATQEINSRKNKKPKARENAWKPTNAEEMKKFLGILLYMGLKVVPKISFYWSTDIFYKNCVIPKVMSRNRFELLLKFLHFSDNQTANKKNRLSKIEELTQMIVSNFKSAYIPGENVTVDESMIPFRGRLLFKQYIKNKAHKYGIKLFKMNSGGGYTHNISIYCGKKDPNAPKTTPHDVVLNLCGGLLNAGRTIYADNFYTSLALATKLYSEKTHLVGTLRKNRKGLPKNVVDTKLNKGDIVGAENKDHVAVLHWKDKRDVYMITTKHGIDKDATTGKPTVVLDYNKNKVATDQSDQLASYGSPIRKCVKWYKKVAFELLLNLAVVNARVIFNEVKESNISMMTFRKKICEQLLGVEKIAKNKNNDLKLNIQRKKPKHELKELSGTKYKKSKLRRNCQPCYRILNTSKGRKYAQSKVKKVTTYCSGCPVSSKAISRQRKNKSNLKVTPKVWMCLSCYNDPRNHEDVKDE